ncbi:MAG: metallopeptidase TldD-related protein [Cyanobacteria bacterium P01_F01_bin.86]
MQDWEMTFNQLIDALLPQLNDDEDIQVLLIAEDSHFTRFNQAKVRQTGTVVNGSLALMLMVNQRLASESISFTGEKESDWPRLMAALQHLREEIPQLPEDPYLVIPHGDEQSRDVYSGELLTPATVVPNVLPQLAGLDAAGLYAGGRSVQAYADSSNQRHWFETTTFTLDYSLFTAEGQAVKGTYAGRTWENALYADTLAASKALLGRMQKPSKPLERGQYRTYFAPAAVADLVNMLSWGGIGEASIRRGGSALGPLQRQERTLSTQVHLLEDFSHGQVSRFNQYGELAPLSMPLIKAGKLVNTLVSARTAKEYDIPSTFAESGEYLRSPVLAPGTLPINEALKALGTGLYVSNLHYLNWSDRPNGRITGMTRYACFWVEGGEIVAPIENLRFDESLYNFWGEDLIALTQETTFVPEVGSYGYRDLGGALVPGMLVDKFTYTL